MQLFMALVHSQPMFSQMCPFGILAELKIANWTHNIYLQANRYRWWMKRYTVSSYIRHNWVDSIRFTTTNAFLVICHNRTLSTQAPTRSTLSVTMVLGMTLNCLHQVIYQPHPGANNRSCWSTVKHQLSTQLSVTSCFWFLFFLNFYFTDAWR